MGLQDLQILSSNANVVEKRTFIEVQGGDDEDGDDLVPVRRLTRAMSDSLLELPCSDAVKAELPDSSSCEPKFGEDNGSTCSDVTDRSPSQDDTTLSQPCSSPRTAAQLWLDSDREENDLPTTSFVDHKTVVDPGESLAIDSSCSLGVYMPCLMGSAVGGPAPVMNCFMTMQRMPQSFPQARSDMPPPGTWFKSNSPTTRQSTSWNEGPTNRQSTSRNEGPTARQSTSWNEGATAAKPSRAQQPTTVIMRNLPEGYMISAVLKSLDMEGFSGYYDFAHVPVDFSTQASMGYAIVNLVNHEIAKQFTEHFQGFNNWASPYDVSDVRCTVEWNATQGLHLHVERYRNSRLMHWSVPAEFRPALFSNGMQLAFPLPTARIKAPRMRPGRSAARGDDLDY